MPLSEAEELELLELEEAEALAKLSDEKPAVSGLLPESWQDFLTPSPREAARRRLARGAGLEPAQPVPEYSTAEEVALSSIIAPATGILPAARAAGAGLISKGAAALKSIPRSIRWGGGFGLGHEAWRGLRGLLRDD